jgi:hypothetical protein
MCISYFHRNVLSFKGLAEIFQIKIYVSLGQCPPFTPGNDIELTAGVAGSKGVISKHLVLPSARASKGPFLSYSQFVLFFK